ncbi:MAG TPA: dihydrofolate reductase family protein [Streptosporangiaceae bacterium]|nr:dihydrofolate reductase family protein [Streptosporangiaceae bacterium]
MGRLIVSTQMTVDGLIEVGEWFQREGEHEEHGSFDQLFAADAMLLGRKTYEGLAAFWPTATDDRGFADKVNAMPKYVASTTLEEPLEWNATLIKGDLTETVPELKRRHHGNLVSYGCGELAYHLVRLGLADEVRFWIHPSVFGSGARPFHGQAPVPLRLISTTTFRSGIALLCYRPADNA